MLCGNVQVKERLIPHRDMRGKKLEYVVRFCKKLESMKAAHEMGRPVVSLTKERIASFYKKHRQLVNQEQLMEEVAYARQQYNRLVEALALVFQHSQGGVPWTAVEPIAAGPSAPATLSGVDALPGQVMPLAWLYFVTAMLGVGLQLIF